MVSMTQFVADNNIRARTEEQTDHNPNMPESRDMNHWRVTLRGPHGRMSLVFSKGYGHNGAEPTPDEVLDCLASDAATVENTNSFEEWCCEFGFETDSRKAERAYRACVRQAESLKRILGPDLYNSLLWNTERL